MNKTSTYHWPSHLPSPSADDIRALALQIQNGEWDVSDAYTLASAVLAFLDAALNAPGVSALERENARLTTELHDYLTGYEDVVAHNKELTAENEQLRAALVRGDFE